MAHIMQRVKVELSWANNFTSHPASLLFSLAQLFPLVPTRAAAAPAISARNSGAQLGKCVCQCVCQSVCQCVCHSVSMCVYIVCVCVYFGCSGASTFS